MPELWVRVSEVAPDISSQLASSPPRNQPHGTYRSFSSLLEQPLDA
jgi:hypothetical protein